LFAGNLLHLVWWANAKWKNGQNPAETQHPTLDSLTGSVWALDLYAKRLQSVL
jgi:hypothetical protein